MTKQQRIIQAIYARQASISWADIESMLRHHGAEITEGRGSRVRVALRGVRAVFHRPHPRKEASYGAVLAVRRLLLEVGIGEEDQ